MNKFENEFSAYKMLRIFFEGYADETERVSDAALEDLKELFGLVAEDERADVYVMFTKLLHARHVNFDVDQFKGGEHE